MRRLRVNPPDCIFIDNNRENLVAPGSLGIKVIHFDDEKQDFNELLAALDAHGACVSDACPSTMNR